MIGRTILDDVEPWSREDGAGSIALSSSLNAVYLHDHHGYEQMVTYSHEFSGHLSTGVEDEVVVVREGLE